MTESCSNEAAVPTCSWFEHARSNFLPILNRIKKLFVILYLIGVIRHLNTTKNGCKHFRTTAWSIPLSPLICTYQRQIAQHTTNSCSVLDIDIRVMKTIWNVSRTTTLYCITVLMMIRQSACNNSKYYEIRAKY